MEKFKCLIIEDEPIASALLEEYVGKVPFLELRETFGEAIRAREYLEKNKVDLVLLDIHLPGLKGIDFIRSLENPPGIIITSAYRDYAVEGFELDVLDYLVKPIRFERFLAAVEKIRVRDLNRAEAPYLYITLNKKKIKLFLHEIRFIESKKDYVNIVTATESYLVRSALGEFESQLPPNLFARVHRSFLVSRSCVKGFSTTTIELQDHRIPIGRLYKEATLNWLSADTN